MRDMEITNSKGGTMTRRNFNQELIQGLFKQRNKRPETRQWLRQCVELERKRRK